MENLTTKVNPNEVTYTPAQVAQQTVRTIDDLMKTPNAGVRIGLSAIDSDMLPMRPGDLTVILGRPSNFKTGFGLFLAMNETKEIMARKSDDEIVIYVTLEELIEEHGIKDLCSHAGLEPKLVARGILDDTQYERIKKASIERGKIPLWLMGHSMWNKNFHKSLRVSDINASAKSIEEKYKKKIKLIVLDYLQLIEAEAMKSERRLQVADAVIQAKMMAKNLGCPVVLLAQAKRDVDLRDFRLPSMGDGGETSSIEHAADKIMSVWMTKNGVNKGDNVPFVSGIVSDFNTLLIGMPKQRKGISQKIYSAEVDFTTGMIVNCADVTDKMKKKKKETEATNVNVYRG